MNLWNDGILGVLLAPSWDRDSAASLGKQPLVFSTSTILPRSLRLLPAFPPGHGSRCPHPAFPIPLGVREALPHIPGSRLPLRVRLRAGLCSCIMCCGLGNRDQKYPGMGTGRGQEQGQGGFKGNCVFPGHPSSGRDEPSFSLLFLQEGTCGITPLGWLGMLLWEVLGGCGVCIPPPLQVMAPNPLPAAPALPNSQCWDLGMLLFWDQHWNPLWNQFVGSLGLSWERSALAP